MAWRRRLLLVSVVGGSVATLRALSADPSYKRAWKAVTSGSPGSDKAGNSPSTPEERERLWAAKIIEQAERRKKVAEIQTVVDKVAEVVEPTPSRPEDKRQRMLLDIFDGRLGKVRLSLRSSAEAMLTIVGDFDAEATSEPGVVVVRGRGVEPEEEVECLVDAKRCSALEFTRRTDQEGNDQYAITMKRLDDSSFLSVLLGGGTKPNEEAVQRWIDLKRIYEGSNFGRVILVPEGGAPRADRSQQLDAGPLRPQGGSAAKGTTVGHPTEAPRQKREVRPVKPEILIPRIE